MVSSVNSGLSTSLALLRSATATTGSTTTGTSTLSASLALLPQSATAVTITRTADPYVNGLLSGRKWETGQLTYSMPTSASQYEYGGEAQSNFHAVNTAQANAIEKALRMFSDVANLDFTRIDGAGAGGADLRFAQSDMPRTAWAYLPSSDPRGGDVWFNYSSGNYANPQVGNYGFHTVVHEIGHGMGLKHAHEKEGLFYALPTTHQSMEYSVMSYSSYRGASTTAGYTNQRDSYAQTLMMDDIAALQAMYGANFDTNADDTVYMWDAATGELSLNGVAQGAPTGNRVFMTVWDGNGTDTYDFSNYASDLVVDLNPGRWTKTSTEQLADLHYGGTRKAIGNIANAKLYQRDVSSLIENAVGGAGNDRLTGNQADNMLTGGAGNDYIVGGLGNDLIIGGEGADRMIGGTGFDTVDYSGASAGITTNMARGGTGGEATGDLYSSIERLIATNHDDVVYSSSAATQLYGMDGNDQLTGGGGADRLDGGNGDDILTGGRGRDYLTGGAGADVFRFNHYTETGKTSTLRDVITDFVVGEDMIDLSGMDANIRALGKQGFTILENPGQAFTGAGQLRVRYESTVTGERTIIEGNIDTYNTADFQIELSGRIEGLTTRSIIV